jgi:nitrogen fixation/metabolism regulation signal transduction histidine kinase
VKLMRRFYKNLDTSKYGRLMTVAFWLFSVTCLILLATIVAINTGVISANLARVIEQVVGPVCALNVAILFYLGDQDAGMAQEAELE